MTRIARNAVRQAIATALKVGAPALGLLSAGTVLATDTANVGGLEEVVVTAQKRSESLQTVPLSLVAIGTAKLEELKVQSFDDYVKYMPSVSYESTSPGFARVFMRGVASGENGNHSGPQPSVGTYLDEQPITTIQGAVDVHIYDIERVEALSGPQGTLYGASSQAGTIRIITNKPDPTAFKAGYNLEVNTVAHGAQGYLAEGFVNLPLSPTAAVRLVGWTEHDSGFIDNLPGTRTYPTSGITISNTAVAKKHYNDVTKTGARASLKLQLGDQWTVTPTLMAQREDANGVFAYDPNVGSLAVTHFEPEYAKDNWVDAALTVQGKIADVDVTYAGAFLKRNDHTSSDYTDYSFFYDQHYGSGNYYRDNADNLIDPSQRTLGDDRYKKSSHELRFSTPKDRSVRFVGGIFLQRQEHGIEQRYVIDNLAQSSWVTGWDHTWWLTEQLRTDRDSAVFGELTWDVNQKLNLTVGLREFHYKNTLAGFFGYGLTSPFASYWGEATCFSTVSINGAPCTNLDKTVSGSGSTPKVNATYKFDDRHMVYATFSKGFRPGGVNRNGSFGPYKSDFLTNYEIGWKTSSADNRVRFNGALFIEDWKDFQFAFLGTQSLTVIRNAGQAQIKGVESQLEWMPTPGLTISAAMTLVDAKLTQNYCAHPDANGNLVTDCPNPEAPSGTQLPVTPKFKADGIARYEWSLGNYDAHVQGALVYQTASRSALRLVDQAILGDQEAYATLDLLAGVKKDATSVEVFITNATDKQADLYRYSECKPTTCGATTYIGVNRPRTIGVRFGQKF
jgi:hypothetical protein